MNETQICETCRHYVLETPGWPDASGRGLGSCSRWRTGYGVRADEIADNEVLVENDEGWAMVMGPKFGCVLHESLGP